MCSDAELIQRTSAGDRAAYEKLYQALRALGLRARPAAARRPRARRGRRAGDVRIDLALGEHLQARARPRRAVALRRRAQRDHRPQPRTHRAAGGGCPTRPRSSRRPRSAPSRRGRAGACTVRSRRCRSASARCVALAYWSDLSQSEVATRLGIPLGTVKTRTRSALQQLAAILEEEEEPNDDESFDDLVDGDDLSPDERRRLEDVHELLVAAGPPPELPAALAGAAAPGRSRRPDALIRSTGAVPSRPPRGAGARPGADRRGGRSRGRVLRRRLPARRPARVKAARSSASSRCRAWPAVRTRVGQPRRRRARRQLADGVPGPSGPPAHPPIAFGSGERTHAVPLGVMRKKIAEHMVASRRTSADVHTVFEINYHRVWQLREQKKAAYERAGAKLTFMSFITKAVVDALRAVPVLNASLDDDRIVYKKDINIGIAVSLEVGADCPGREGGGRREPARAELHPDLADRARAKQLKPDEVKDQHLYDHQPRRARRAVRPADHQPAAGRDPRCRRHREARRRDRRCHCDPADGVPRPRFRSPPD